jgi:WD40 repeat protein
VETGQELLRQQFPGDVLATLALSPDGSTVALGSGPNSHKLFLWNWQTAEGPRPLKAPRYCGHALAFSPDGRRLAECGNFEPTVRVWDVAGGRLLYRLELPDHEPCWHQGLAFSPDGKVLAASASTNSRGMVHLWDPATGKFLKRLPVAGGSLAFSPDGKLLAADSRVWDFVAGKELSANDEAHRGTVGLVLAAEKDLVVTASDDNTIRTWDAATGKQRQRLVHGNWVRAIALSPDARLLASNSLDDTVCLWDVATGRKIYRLAGHGRLGGQRAVAFLPGGKAFLSWGDDRDLRKWDVRTGKAVFEHAIRPSGIELPGADDEPFKRDMLLGVSDGRFTPDGKYLVLHAGASFFVFDSATGQELRHFPTESNFSIGTAISPDSKLLLTSAWGKPVVTKLPGGGMQSSLPKSHPVTWWDLTTGRQRQQILLPGGQIGPVAFSPDGRRFAVASSEPGTIRVVEVLTGREAYRIEGFRGRVQSLAFMPDGRRLVSGMDDSTALVWDLTQKR